VSQDILQQINRLPIEDQYELLSLVTDIEHAEALRSAKNSFHDYVRYIWPAFIEGQHHRIMEKTFDRVIKGEAKRVIINLAPRHTKSEFSSFLLPSYYMGHFPDRKIIQATHTADLAKGFGRKVRNLVATDRYQDVFPDTKLTPDAKAAGRWSTSAGGEYLAVGVGARIAGYGADLFIVDDPHSEQDYIRALGGDNAAFDDTYEWYQTGPRQRLQPGAAIVILMTRWHTRDVTGRLIKKMTQGGEKWEVIEFPAILPSGNPVWPEYWKIEELLATKETLSPQQWNAQYLQAPTSEEGALIKRDWWKIWESDTPPVCEFVIQSWDTAYTTKTINDYSACTTWGVFYLEDKDEGNLKPNIILLDALRKRMEFPELKRRALEEYERRQPDAFVIEAKASGLPLVQELRSQGIIVTEFTPTRGNDKIVRVNAVSDLFASGVVWCPDTRWAEEVRDEFAAFPSGDHDDYVDSGTQALLRFRQGGFIPLDSDEDDGEHIPFKADYY
jgi:predicted phage terminase large subunit-like protein